MKHRWMYYCLILCLTVLATHPLCAESPPKLPPLEAVVSSLDGDVEIRRNESDGWEPAEQGDELLPGHRIRTGNDATARVSIPGVLVTELSPKTDVEIQELLRKQQTRRSLISSEDVNVNKIKIEAREGTVKNAVREHSGVETDYELKVQSAVAGIRGTVFMVDLTDEESMVTSVLEGDVLLYQSGNREGGRRVSGGQKALYSLAERAPRSVQSLDDRTASALDDFRKRTQDQLEVPPWLGSFSLDGNEFEEEITIAYEEQQSLTFSGIAEAQEGDRTLSTIRVDGDFGRHTFETDGTRREKWTVTAQPDPPAEGEKRTLSIDVRAEDSEGRRSPVYSPRIVLVHPEDRGSRKPSDLEQEGIRVSKHLRGDPLLGEPVVRDAIDRLASARDAFVRGDVNGYHELFQGASEIQTMSGRRSTSDFRETLRQLFPLLEEPNWSLVLVDVSVDGDRLQLTVRSEYSGQIVELVGLQPSNPEPDPSEVVRRRPVEDVRTSGSDRFVFDRSSRGPPLSSGRISLFVDRSTLDEVDRQRSRWQVKNTLFGLFYSYEQGNVDAVAERVHPDFLSVDENGFRHDYSDFLESVRIDLDNLYDIAYSIWVNGIQFEGSTDQARVEIEWDRRARLGNTNQLWLSGNNSSVLHFRRSSPYRLTRITGDAVMGLSSPQTGSTLVRGGTLDGTVFTPQTIDAFRTISNFTGGEFPELTEEQATTIASEGCLSGTVSSDVTEDVTWCNSVNVTSSITVASGVTLTIKDGTTVEFDGSVSLSIQGAMDATGVTFKKSGGTHWGGILVKDNATVEIASSTIKGAVSPSEFALVELQGTGITYRSTGNDYLGGGTIRNGVQGTNDGAATIVFDNDIFKNFVKMGFCNSGTGGTCGTTFADDGYDGVVIKNSDFIFNGDGTFGAEGALTGHDYDGNGNPSITLENNYIGGNAGNSCYTTSTATNDSQSPNTQYFEISSRTSPRSTTNRATDPGLTSCAS